jgi:formylglycine-generating enzyme required for sulfatase activity
VPCGQYAAFAKATGHPAEPPDFEQTDDHPVVNVTRDDAQAYAAWLSRTIGKPYRLPTEAAWEYAARAETTTAHYWGDSAAQICQDANGDDATTKCSDGYPNTAPVGHFRANPSGLHDMLGNAWQWVRDCDADPGYRGAALADGSVHEARACPSRVVRGGSFGNGPSGLLGGNRGGFDPGTRYGGNGFRVARTVKPPKPPVRTGDFAGRKGTGAIGRASCVSRQRPKAPAHPHAHSFERVSGVSC